MQGTDRPAGTLKQQAEGLRARFTTGRPPSLADELFEDGAPKPAGIPAEPPLAAPVLKSRKQEIIAQLSAYFDALEATLSQVGGQWDEIVQYRVPAPVNYDASGFEALFRAIQELQAYCDRANTVYATALRLRATADRVLRQAQALHDDARDAVTVDRLKNLDMRLSFGERGSHYNVAMMDIRNAYRRVEDKVKELDAITEAIGERYKGLDRARYALTAAADVLKAGLRTHEVN